MAYFRVEKLVKKFGGLTAVNEVTFEVEKGEIFGLIGPNGSGKTTTFNMISGVYPPTSGKVVYQGREIQGMKSHRICHLGIGRTFQVVKPLGRMTVLDNVIAAAFSRVNSMRGAREVAEKTMEFCGLRRSRRCWPSRCRSRAASGWRSPGRWRPSRNCCSSTRRRRG